MLCGHLALPISIIINSTFIRGHFPAALKNISITALPKVEYPSKLTDFRPISNANFLLKIISSITCEQLTQYAEENKLLSDDQFGFRKYHSCTSAILRLTEEFHDAISREKCIVLLLLDFRNAYGSVDHNKLLQVLESCGISVNAMKWYKSFLSGWNQVVKHDGMLSEEMTIERGIIQGENNSQLLFSLFINNIIKYIRICKKTLFADDVQIHVEAEVAEVKTGIENVNTDLLNIERFCEEFGIEINTDKTKAIILSSKGNLNRLKYDNLPKIYYKGNEIEYVDNVRDLGYQLNRTITSNDHVKITQQKVFGAINSLWPLKRILPREIKLQLYRTLILPIFDYMDVVYHEYGIHGTKGNELKLEKLQNICIRYISDIPRREHITQHRIELNLLPLGVRRALHVACLINKIINGEAPPCLNKLIDVNKNNLRSNDKLITKMPKNNFHKTSFLVGAPSIWNNVPSAIRSINECDKFKENYLEYLKMNQK